jgi:hypothetical protein
LKVPQALYGLILLADNSAMKKTFIALFSCLATACASTDAPRSAAPDGSLVLHPAQVHEVCRDLKAGQTVRWQFVASGMVDFNVHYHVGNAVEYPFVRVGVQEAASAFTAPNTQEYCWMWTNRSGRDIALRAKLEP